ncbi:glycosyltransferase family 4 protein [Candidatus Blastococcus massiliensis]|uniref:glycosyltransferase family 4 protein n=1 Tax=Candidatus Blastococcus massiliensis TaxID=1470358 RepID=UPI0004AFE3C4|nr:glycosyltransferase family 4 protein [Candidatus Blastococcus massiliensis]
MRIAWCTPFSPRSAIGAVGALAVDALRRTGDVDVDIWYPVDAGGRTWPDPGREIDETTVERLAEYDAVVYNIGDQPVYHGPIMDLAHAVPGVVILHDLSIVHLVYNRLREVGDDHFARTMQRWYGPEGEQAAREGLARPEDWLWRPETVQTYPMTEIALEHATGVVTHSAYAAEALRDRYVGDVTVVPLPVSVEDADAGSLDSLGLPDDRLVVLQAGVLNPNKHVHTVVEAIAEAGLGDRVHLVVCGHAQPQDLERLRRHIDDLGLTRSSTVLGEVSDQTLNALRTRADIATILRHPCGEAASAVLAESLAFGLPVVSVDDGCYREAPADAVSRVPTPPSASRVAAALRRWVDAPEARERASAVAREFAREQHSPEAYARGILDALATAGAARRRTALAEDLARIAARSGYGPESSLVTRLAARAHELFGAAPRRLPPTFPPGGDSAL